METWLSHEVATRKLALGLNERQEIESEGGWATWNFHFRGEKSLNNEFDRFNAEVWNIIITSKDLLGLVFAAPKVDIVINV